MANMATNYDRNNNLITPSESYDVDTCSTTDKRKINISNSLSSFKNPDFSYKFKSIYPILMEKNGKNFVIEEIPDDDNDDIISPEQISEELNEQVYTGNPFNGEQSSDGRDSLSGGYGPSRREEVLISSENRKSSYDDSGIALLLDVGYPTTTDDLRMFDETNLPQPLLSQSQQQNVGANATNTETIFEKNDITSPSNLSDHSALLTNSTTTTNKNNDNDNNNSVGPFKKKKSDRGNRKKGDTMCGIGRFHPACLQKYANIKLFSIHYALAILSILMFHTNFIGSVTSIEKRFGFPSRKSGFLMSVNDIGHVPFVIIASFYLGNARKPFFLGLGTVLFAIGVFFITLPYFIYGPGEQYKGISIPQATTASDLRNFNESSINKNNNISQYRILPLDGKYGRPTVSDYLCHPFGEFRPNNISGRINTIPSQRVISKTKIANSSSSATAASSSDFNRLSYVLMCVGEIILGIGGSWIGPLGMAYIDDNVKKAKSVPIYMAVVSCVRSLGPVFGFLLSALCAGIHESLINPGLDKRDPRWVGAWWLGFSVIIIIQLIFGIPLMLYPKKMKTRSKYEAVRNKTDEEEPIKEDLDVYGTGTIRKLSIASSRLSAFGEIEYQPLSRDADVPTTKTESSVTNTSTDREGLYTTKYPVAEKRKLTNILKAVKDLVQNPVYILTTIGECISIYSIVGYMIFLPKFMESQFALSASTANTVTGALGVLSSSTGIILGGYVMKKLNIKLRGALLISITGLCITSIKAVTLMNLKCEPMNLAGHKSEITGFWNFSTGCNIDCMCDLNRIEPVCGKIDKKLYLNPCFAGCTDYIIKDKKIKAYTNCSCLVGGAIINNLANSPPFNQSNNHHLLKDAKYLKYTNNKFPNLTNEDVINMAASVVPGLCFRSCKTFIPYLIIMALGSFLAAPSIVAVMMVKLRCVTQAEKPFALGFSSFLMSIIAFLPGPMITGALIDKTCLVWKQQGSCMFYDTDKLRFVIHGILATSKVIAIALYLFAFKYSKLNRYKELEKIHYQDGKKHYFKSVNQK